MFVSLVQGRASRHFVLFLIIASQFKWCVPISDVATTFLNASLPPEALYAVKMPSELAAGKSRVCRMKKALCGLRRPPRFGQEHVVAVMLGMVLSRQIPDNAVFCEEQAVCSRACRRFDRDKSIPVTLLVFLRVARTFFVHTSHTELHAHHTHDDERRNVDEIDFGKTRLRASSI